MLQHYLLDENLSRKLVHKLASVYQNISHVSTEGFLNSFDEEIWRFAKEKKSIIITKDYDFSNMSHLYGCPPKVIKLNCGNRTTEFIENLLLSNFELFSQFAESEKCYLDIF